MHTGSLLGLVAIFTASTGEARDIPPFEANSFYLEHDSLGTYYPYVVHIPDRVEDTSSLPAQIFLHGTGSSLHIPPRLLTSLTMNGFAVR